MKDFRFWRSLIYIGKSPTVRSYVVIGIMLASHPFFQCRTHLITRRTRQSWVNAIETKRMVNLPTTPQKRWQWTKTQTTTMLVPCLCQPVLLVWRRESAKVCSSAMYVFALYPMSHAQFSRMSGYTLNMSPTPINTTNRSCTATLSTFVSWQSA